MISCQGIEIVENCTQWTSQELELLYETLGDHILQEFIDGQIMFVRAERGRWAGLERSGIEDGVRTSQIWISDAEWRSPPAASLFDIFDRLVKKPAFFQGTIAHELTHSAVWFHPE